MAGSSRLRRNGGSDSLQHLLEGALGNLEMGGKLREQAAQRAWEQVVGRVVGRHTKAEALRDGVLLVATDSPAWAQEMHMRQAELLGRLAPLVGEGVIREIHFRSGYRRPPEEAPPQETPASLQLSARQQNKIRGAADHIADPELRAKAEQAFASLVKIATWRKRQGWRQCLHCGQWQRTGKRWCNSCLHRGERE